MTRRPSRIWLMLALAGCAPEPTSASETSAEATTGAEVTPTATAPASTLEIDVRDPWVGLLREPESTAGSARATAPSGLPERAGCERPARPPLAPAARAAVERGLVAARRGEDGAATAAFEEALRLDPGASVAAYDLGVLAARAGRLDAAAARYTRALELAPGDDSAVRGLVSVRLASGDVEGALRLVASLAQTHGGDPHLAALHGEVLVVAGRYDEAWTAARSALACDERFVPGLVVLVRASIAQGRRELADAILTQALAVNESSAELHLLRGTLLLEDSAMLREARAALRRAAELRPDYAAARLRLGRELLESGAYAEAVPHLEAAARLAPASLESALALADAYRAAGRRTEALAAFTDVLRRQPGLAAARYDLALLYAGVGDALPGVTELEALRRAVAEMDTFVRSAEGAGDTQAREHLAQWRRQLERLERRQAMEAAAPAPVPAEQRSAPTTPPPTASDEVEFFE